MTDTAPTAERIERVMRAILASVPDGVVGVYHATIYAEAALAALALEVEE